MIITVLTLEPVKLLLTFTEDELEHPLFKSTMSKMYNSDDYDAHKKDEDVSITLNTIDNTIEVVGQSVDAIRQLWCGDVNPEADLTSCPCFTLGETDPPKEPDTT